MTYDPVLGDMKYAEGYKQIKVKASLIRSRGIYLVEKHGQAALDRIMAMVSPQAREYLSDPPSINSWADYEPLLELDRTMILELGGGNADMMRIATRELAPRNLSTIYKVFLRLGSPKFLISKLGAVWKTLFQKGEMTWEHFGAKESRIELAQCVVPLYMCGFGCVGWIEAGLSLCGAKGVEIEHSSCVHRGDSECSWQIRWK